MKARYPKRFLEMLVDQTPVFDEMIVKSMDQTDNWVSTGVMPLFPWMTSVTSECLINFNDDWNRRFKDRRFPASDRWEPDWPSLSILAPDIQGIERFCGNDA